METRIAAMEAEEKKSQHSREKWKYREQEKNILKNQCFFFFLNSIMLKNYKTGRV